MFTSLQTRFTVVLIGIALLPIISISIFITNQGFAKLQDAALTSQRQTSRAVESKIQEYVNQHVSNLTLLDNTLNFISLSEDEQRSILSNLLAQTPGFQNLYLLTPNGDEVLQVNRYFDGGNDLNGLQVSYEDASVQFSSIRFDDATHEPIITIHVPVLNLRSGEIDQVIVADLRLNPVWDVLASFDFSTKQVAYVVDSTQQVIAHPNPSVVLAETRFAIPETDGRVQGLSSEDVILGSRTMNLGNQTFTIVAEQDFSEATKLGNDLLNFAVTSVIAVLVIASLIAVSIAQRVVKPINIVAEVAHAYAKGDLSQRIQVHSKDEIGQLSKTFNEMADAVQKREVELRQARDEALTAQRIANENSRLKSEFLSMMSHELRTPMNAIKGFAGILLNRMAGVDFNNKAERYLGKIQANSDRLLGLINDILDLSRIESGRLELAYLPMSPQEMVNTWHGSLSILADNKNLAFEVNVDPNLPETIYGDEESISKIAINLVGNAIKFTEEGSVTLDLQRHGSQMELKVTDTGIGIPPHAKDYIFDEFRQVDQSSTRKYGGTGLGLAIVQKLVREMGGQITLESEVEVGSTFTVLLPMQADEATQKEVA